MFHVQPYLGEMIQFDLRIFFGWVGKNHQLVMIYSPENDHMTKWKTNRLSRCMCKFHQVPARWAPFQL